MRLKTRREIEAEKYEFVTLLRILRDYPEKRLQLFLDTLQLLREDDTISEDLVEDWILARIEVEEK